ncbi:MAG TPA: hypothetical protein VKN76_03180 [Kiloniellaceae bacterium]|nr:hypothetical protein [Kiloniellaceae bacterium]
MIPIRRTARKDASTQRKAAASTPDARREPDFGVAPPAAAAASGTGGMSGLADHAPVAVPSCGGNLLRLYFTRSFKRRQRPGNEARKAAYSKGDLSARRDPDFGLSGGAQNRAARPAEFSQALRTFRED